MSELLALKDSIRLSGVISEYVKLRRDRDEWRGSCPFHNEATASFTVNDRKGFYHCFGCGAHGDVFDFLKQHTGATIPEAKGMISNMSFLKIRTYPHADQKDWLSPVVPAYLPDYELFKHGAYGKPENIWIYRDANSEVLFFVCRFAGKHFRPLSLWQSCEGHESWQWKSLPSPKPLFGLDRLAKHPDATVVVCEGEKAAEAVERVVDGCVGVCWPNGASAVSQALWEPLYGRNVFLWPDADEPGYKAMAEVRDLIGNITNIGPDIEVPLGIKKGWDAADALTAGFVFSRKEAA